MKKNPFTLMYVIPKESVVSRDENISKIINSFVYQDNMYAYLITGIRGSGKTVLLRSVEEKLSQREDWDVININPQGDIISSLANKLYDLGSIKKIIGKVTVSLKLGVLTLTRESGEKISDAEIIIMHMMETFKKANRRILISIDEVNDTKEFRQFINVYQTLIAKKMPLYLLMTGLPENINVLINDKAMTFLSRSPKIELTPLPLINIATNYSSIFSIDYKKSAEMAKLTNGYAFAYQVLGYLMFENNKKEVDDDLLKEYDHYLWNHGYNKFWQDLTNIERTFLISLAESNGEKDAIINHGFSQSNYSQYRRRLLEKGLIYAPKQGTLDFVLPRFKEYVFLMKEFE